MRIFKVYEDFVKIFLHKPLQNQKNYVRIIKLKAVTETAYPKSCITERPTAENGHAHGAPFTSELARGNACTDRHRYRSSKVSALSGIQVVPRDLIPSCFLQGGFIFEKF